MTFSVVKGSGSASIKELSDFKSFLLMKKLEVQSLKTYSSFKDNFTKKFLKNEMKKEKTPVYGALNEPASKTDNTIDKVKELLKSSGPVEDPQIQFGRLAFLYAVMNRGDLATITSIKRVCTFDGLLEGENNANICGVYSDYLGKLIELRIGIVTSRILYANGVLGIPRGWYAHVEEVTKELQANGMITDSLRHLMILLTTVAKSNEEIDSSLVPHVLSPKSFISNSSSGVNQPNQATLAASPRANVTVDATHLTRQLTENMKQQQQQVQQPQFDSSLTRMLPNMLIL